MDFLYFMLHVLQAIAWLCTRVCVCARVCVRVCEEEEELHIEATSGRQRP